MMISASQNLCGLYGSLSQSRYDSLGVWGVGDEMSRTTEIELPRYLPSPSESGKGLPLLSIVGPLV